MPAVTVIIPTRKRNHLLPRALESVYNQTFSDFEVILVDDNPPETRVQNDRNLDRWLNDKRLRLIENPVQKNAATARNAALRIAGGEWITYLDDDDSYHRAKLEKQWNRAKQTKLPVGLCGLAYNLTRRRRIKQTDSDSFCGVDLLLRVIADTKAIFHKRTNKVFFDESLDAGEDLYFFFQLVDYFQVNEVFNVPEALIEVYLQPGSRVNLNGNALWKASLAVYNDYALAYGERASRIFVTRAEVQRCRFHSDNIELLKHSLALIGLTGLRDLRLIGNTYMFKIPWLRRYLVS